MIEIHVIVGKEHETDIVNRVSDGKFEIRNTFTTRNGLSKLYLISADEEEITILRLKYGNDKVWLR